MRDDDQLEISLLLSRPDDVVERLGQGADVVAVEVRRRFVQRDELPASSAQTPPVRPRDHPGRRRKSRWSVVTNPGRLRVRTPQFVPKHSASASRIKMHASTFWPALHRPRMSISASCLTIQTCTDRQPDGQDAGRGPQRDRPEARQRLTR